MPALTWFLVDGVDSGGWQALSTSTQSAVTTAAGWVVGTGATNHSELAANTERASTTFTGTTVPDGTLDTSLKDAFRSPTPLYGDFAAANWSFQFAVRSPTQGGAADGRIRFRLIKANADGSNATEITAAQQQASLVTNVDNVSDFNSTLTLNPGAFSMNGQHLFIQIAWERTGAGGMTTTNIRLRTGSASTPTGTVITTSTFTELLVVIPKDTGLVRKLSTKTGLTHNIDNILTSIYAPTAQATILPRGAQLYKRPGSIWKSKTEEIPNVTIGLAQGAAVDLMGRGETETYNHVSPHWKSKIDDIPNLPTSYVEPSAVTILPRTFNLYKRPQQSWKSKTEEINNLLGLSSSIGTPIIPEDDGRSAWKVKKWKSKTGDVNNVLAQQIPQGVPRLPFLVGKVNSKPWKSKIDDIVNLLTNTLAPVTGTPVIPFDDTRSAWKTKRIPSRSRIDEIPNLPTLMSAIGIPITPADDSKSVWKKLPGWKSKTEVIPNLLTSTLNVIGTPVIPFDDIPSVWRRKPWKSKTDAIPNLLTSNLFVLGTPIIPFDDAKSRWMIRKLNKTSRIDDIPNLLAAYTPFPVGGFGHSIELTLNLNRFVDNELEADMSVEETLNVPRNIEFTKEL